MVRRFFDYIFLLRPVLFLPVWAFLFIGYIRMRILGLLDLKPVFNFDRTFWLAFLAYSLLMGSIYILNQIFDIETDRENKKLFLLADGFISLRNAWIYMALLVITSFFIVNLFLKNSTLLTIWMLSLLLGILYSTPPFKFKGRPFLDLLSNAFGYGFLNFLFGAFALADPPGEIYRFALPYVTAVGGVFLFTTIPDIPGDKKSGDITTGVFLGPKYTTLLGLLFLFVSLISSYFTKDPIVFWTALLTLPFFAFATFKNQVLFVKIAYRIGTFVFGFLLSIKVPLYLGIGLLTFIALKLYYKWRFNLNYPSLKGK